MRAVFLDGTFANVGHSVTAIFLLSGLLGACATPDTLTRHEFERPLMGTVFRIVLFSADPAEAEAAAQAAFDRIDELNTRLSDYDPTSELSRLSATAGSGQSVTVSGDLWRMLEVSQNISIHSEGAFDITVGPVTRLWRRARRQRELPAAEPLAAARSAVGHEKVVLDRRRKTATLAAPDMRLDLGGIAKGYACDEALTVLHERGLHRAMVVGGGDVVAGDPPPRKTGWTVAIEPLGLGRDREPGVAPRSILLSRAAVSTSGDAFQFVEIDGKRYSHIVDPRTGLGLTTPMGVTVIAPNGTTSDAYATALNVLGPARGLELIETVPGAAAIFVWQDESGQVHVRESRRVRGLRFVTEHGQAAAP